MSADGLRQAHERRERARAALADHDESHLDQVASARREFLGLLRRYEDVATGTGNFATYVEFQEEVAELVEGLPAELPAREAFEDAADELEQRTLRSKHFEASRQALAPAGELTARLDELEAARRAYADAYHAARDRRNELEEQMAELSSMQEHGRVDLDASVEELRDPMEAYDEAVTTAFRSFRREASARELFAVLEAADQYPLVEMRQPPPRLTTYITDRPAGTETLPTLLEYAQYSTSKLEHYVDDPQALKRTIGGNQTFLEGLDADPVTVGWPPPPADDLAWRTREYEPVVGRFADESVRQRLRTVRDLTRRADYGRLRAAAVARAELDPEQVDRVRSGTVEEDLEAARTELERITTALDEHPAP